MEEFNFEYSGFSTRKKIRSWDRKESVELNPWQLAAIQRALEVVRDEHTGMIEGRSLGRLIEKITQAGCG